MKVMFVVYGYLPGKNSAIISRLSDYLTSKNIEVIILSYSYDGSRSRVEKYGNETIYNVKLKTQLRFFRKAVRITLERKENYFFRILYNMIINFFSRFLYIDKDLVESIKYYFITQDVDMVIPVIQQSIGAVSTFEAQKGEQMLRYVPYFLDPFASNQFDVSQTDLKVRLEQQIYESCFKAIVTHEMFAENHVNEQKKYIQKMIPLGFPSVQKIIFAPADDDILFSKDNINCAFIGNLYCDIRTPEFILKIFELIDDERFVLHLVGGGQDSKEINEAQSRLGERLVLHGPVSTSAAKNVMLYTDILVNIGNNISNMVPSKIFEYFSSGKPLINTYKNIDCPTIEYFNRYPLAFNMYERDPITAEVISSFIEFCINNQKKNVDFDTVHSLYYNYTLEYVGERFIEVVKNS